MKLSKLVEIGGATLGAALVGWNAIEQKRKEEERKKEQRKEVLHRVAFYSSLITAGLALWEMKRHRHASA